MPMLTEFSVLKAFYTANELKTDTRGVRCVISCSTVPCMLQLQFAAGKHLQRLLHVSIGLADTFFAITFMRKMLS